MHALPPAIEPPHRVAVIAGDGIGAEVSAEALALLEAAAPGRFVFEHLPWSADWTLRTGTIPSRADLEALRGRSDAVFLGALGDPRIPDHAHARAIVLGLRSHLDLWLNVRPARLLAPDLWALRRSPDRPLDLLLYRENTEGLYVDIGGVLHRGTDAEVAMNQMVASRRATRRILVAAFEAARARRGRVTLVSKHNAVTHAYGLWHRLFLELAAEYPDVTGEALFADVAAMELVRAPERFDVMVMSNMLGDILSDLAAQLVGGLGLAPAANLAHAGGGAFGVFEPVHGSAIDIAGRDVANPAAAMLAAAMMARELGEGEVAQAMEGAVAAAILGGARTRDLGGTLGTAAFGRVVRKALGEGRSA